MRPSDLALKFAVAFSLIAAGLVPILGSLDNVARVIVGLERHGNSLPAAFFGNVQGFGTYSLVVLACILAFSAGVTLAIVSLGRTMDYVSSMSGRRPRALRF